MGGSDPPVTLVERLRAAGCVFAEDEARVLVASAGSTAELERYVQRRITGEPLEVIVGWAEFRGIRIAIDPGVFVPRQRTTGYLAGRAIALAPATALDLCCGSGAVGAAILAEVPGADLYAADIDPAAVCCARRNLPSDRVFEGDLFAPLPADLRFDVIVANAPYVPTADIERMPSEARDFEPRVTLDGGVDGLDVHRRIAAGATQRLTPGGHLLIEVAEDQAPAAAALFAAAGLSPRIEHDEDLEATVVLGRL